MSSTDPRTRAEMEDELTQLDAHISELRITRGRITYDLEWALKERDRLRRNLASSVRNETRARFNSHR